jgi:hypothetical protein
MALSALEDLKNILLRTYPGSVLPVKGSSLTWTQEDMNFVRIFLAIIEVALANASNFQVFNPATEYSQTTPATYKAYDGKVYKYIGASPSTGITPGTNNLYWQEVPQGEFAHQQNTDSSIAFGTVNYTTALEIRNTVNSVKKFYIGTNPPGDPQNGNAGYSRGSFGLSDANTLFICTAIGPTTATWDYVWGSGD